MVLTGSCPWPRSWSRSHGAHLHLQAREDPNTNGDGGSVHFSLPGQAMSNKADLRRKARAHRATLTRSDYAGAIARYASDLDLVPGAVVAGYFPFRDEADPRALMAALSAKGHQLALPVVESGLPLVFRAWKMGDAMHANADAYGIPEPLAAAPAVVPALVLVPLLAFDADGHRLGYGGGYYDRTLDALKGVPAVGIAYAGQEVPLLPREGHDHPLDAVITENGLVRFHHT
jgi:5-formyltetrahydrofolate cyclo-ligase